MGFDFSILHTRAAALRAVDDARAPRGAAPTPFTLTSPAVHATPTSIDADAIVAAMKAISGSDAPPSNASATPIVPDSIATELGLARRPDGSVDAKAVAEKLEGVFVSMLLTQMREAGGIHPFGESAGAQIFEGVFDQQLGESLSRSGGLGLARSIEESIARMQFAASGPPADEPAPAPSNLR